MFHLILWLVFCLSVTHQIPQTGNSKDAETDTTGQNLISSLLQLSDIHVPLKWSYHDMHALSQTSSQSRTEVDIYLHTYAKYVYKSIANTCSHDIIVKVHENYKDAFEYFFISRELHLSLDTLLAIKDRRMLKKCISKIIEMEKSPLLENIWFHINSIAIVESDNFEWIISEWKKSRPHFYVFKFPDYYWAKENAAVGNFLINNQFHWTNPDKLMNPQERPITYILRAMKLLSFTKLNDMEDRWVALAVPDNPSAFDLVKNRESTRIEFIWAIPYYSWGNNRISELAKWQLTILIPFPSYPNRRKKSFVQVVSDTQEREVLVTWAFGSWHLKDNQSVLTAILRRLYTINNFYNSISISLPSSIAGKRNVTVGHEQLIQPDEWIYNLIMNKINPKFNHLLSLATNPFFEIKCKNELSSEAPRVRGHTLEDGYVLNAYYQMC